MLHAQRRENMLLDIVVEVLAGKTLHDIAGQRRAVIRIGGHFPGRKDARWQMRFDVVGEFHLRCRVVGDQILQRFLETGRMGHQVTHGDGLAVIRRNLEIQIGIDVVVEVDLALFDELHHRRPGEQLGDRARPEQGGRRVDRRACGSIGVSVAFLHQHLPVFHHDHDGAGDIAARDRVGHETVQP